MKPTNKFLSENIHSLITPEFSGTHEEILASVNYWVNIVSMLRTLPITVISHENRTAILRQLEIELAGINSELGNNTAIISSNVSGVTDMNQMLTVPSQDYEISNEIDLSIAEEINRMRNNAGISPKLSPLQKIFK